MVVPAATVAMVAMADTVLVPSVPMVITKVVVAVKAVPEVQAE